MALLDCDSFDYYTSTTQRWSLNTGSGSPSISAGNGRNGTASMRRPGGRSGAYRSIGTSQTTLIMGASFEANNPGNNNRSSIFEFGNGANPACCLAIDTADGRLYIMRGNCRTGTVIGTSDYVYTWGETIYLEWKVFFSTTVGTFEIRVNEVSRCSGTGANTGASSVTQFAIGTMNADSLTFGWTVNYDDLYVCNASGSVNNDFLGDISVEALFPNGAGSSSGWTRGGTDSGANWSQVDEAAPNDDTDYVAASVAATKDLYAFTDLSVVTGDVKAVVTKYRAKKDDAGSRVLSSKVKSGTTEAQGANYAPGTSYGNAQDVFETNPDTSSAWTIADVNGIEAGPVVVS